MKSLSFEEKLEGMRVNEKIRMSEKNVVLSNPHDETTYTILLRNGVVLHPQSRQRFSKLCYERYNQIRKAFGFENGKQIVVIG